MLLTRLKHDTRELHEQVEQTLSLFDRQPSRDEYHALLKKFYGYYRPLEEGLARLDWDQIGFAWEPRRKTPLLERDLLALGETRASLEAIPRCGALPLLETAEQALGALYVLEGSTLGGQIITRRLHDVAGPPLPTTFFTSYGADVGAMWKSFGAFLTEYASNADQHNSVVESARRTFETLKAWLADQGEQR